MPLNEIKLERKSQLIVKQILDLVKSGEYSEGDKFPPEREVADKLGVSRPLVREAYSALQLMDVIETRIGDGTYVKTDSFDNTSYVDQAATLLEEEKDPIKVHQAREAIETGNMKFVIQNITDGDLKEIESEYEKMKQAVNEEDYEGYFETDRSLHSKIAEAAHNPFLEESISSLLEVMKERLWRKMKRNYFLDKEGQLQRSLRTHLSIIRSIKEGDKEKATKNMSEHFQEFEHVFEE